MNIHEYQAKNLLAKYGVPVPNGGVAYSPEEAFQVAQDLGGPVWVVKSQIHAGGRGAGRFANDPEGKGGVRVCKSLDEVRDNAEAMLGSVLVTRQTGEAGKEVKRLYIEEGADIRRELYLALLIDRATSRVTVMASTEGGVEIEEVAAESPEKIRTTTIDPATGAMPFHARKIAFGLDLTAKQIKTFVKVLTGLYKAFTDLDASLLEINPLIITGDESILPLDAKMAFDGNAMFRQKEVAELRDLDEEDPAEIEASRHELNYIKLDGNIGCMVNGAGLAMATMDIIKLHGGEPANFLDVGGGANKERVVAAFKIILGDKNVEGILVNIFGGIVRCDVIAEAVVAAAQEVALHVPLVVRLEGTNVDMGKNILKESGLKIIPADDLADGARKVVQAVEEAA
jgi:succinyl-CoA synthetase beta subunit